MDRNVSAIHELASDLQVEEIDLGAHSSPDGAVTIMFTDIEGSTALIEELGEPAWFAAIQDHNARVRELVAAHSGAEVKAQGDGFMIAFDSAHAGLRCAIAMQREMAGRPMGQTERELRVRVGAHSGFVIQEAEDFFGRNVVLAARIADYASGGQILVSSALKEHTETDPTFSYEYVDDVHFKGLLGEHKIYAVPWKE